jgi:lipoyl(octanoyl) transferase
VWLPPRAEHPERKVAAVGVRVAREVTRHGFALNCDPDLTAFARIVPCGIADAGVTSLSAELGRTVGVGAVLPAVQRAVLDALDGRLPVTDHELLRAPAPAGLALHLDAAIAGH